VNWRNRGACKPRDTDRLFFSPDGEGIGDHRRREAAAKLVCGRCPVRVICLDHALSVPEKYGVWGGLGEEELRELRGARARWAKAS
jgi:WhiB family redox-sensing transcriptional regulator